MFSKIKSKEEIKQMKEAFTKADKTVKKDENFFVELIKFSLLALLIVVPIRMFIAQPFFVQGKSMYPTFDDNHYLVVDQLTYRFHEPERGDVIVMRYPKDLSKFFIKRIIGLPGETVVITDGHVSITADKDDEEKTIQLDDSFVQLPKKQTLSVTLDNNSYYVMGDNRANSSDSRAWGPLPRQDIVGRAWLRLYPFNQIEYLPGKQDLSIPAPAPQEEDPTEKTK